MRKAICLLGIMTMCLFVFTACRQGDYKSMPVDEFQNVLKQEGIQLVDVRTGVEYSEGHIPDAVNINVMDISFKTLVGSILEKNMPVAVYCRSGKRSKKAAEILSGEGYKVYELDKGFNSWQQSGKDMVK